MSRNGGPKKHKKKWVILIGKKATGEGRQMPGTTYLKVGGVHKGITSVCLFSIEDWQFQTIRVQKLFK